MKVLINRCYGGYGISDEAIELWLEKKYLSYDKEFYRHGSDYRILGESRVNSYTIDRADPFLIEVFEELGSNRTSSAFADLELVELPDGCEYSIGEYDGKEWIENTWINVTIEELKAGLSDEMLEKVSQVESLKIL